MEKKRKEILEEIVGKLEWSKLSYQGVGKLSIFCCPLCGGVKEGYYEKERVWEKSFYLKKGHHSWCPFNQLTCSK